ncbi:cytochrome ubiquinol oxidase subunit I [Aquisalinus flavus]|uniref:Cytochrome ubiquinol oxidase subunit I n=1 Tax=Aquisalinus flavus TaxID=1526572 RepID=A0A8J2V668_9PROT|nr:cytochrome ubiquinol oxidase subunit I [Aquisalinus flavus]MBD0425632.1 cytochrome ubiquinol oxidase subunit I [Aquisalinus flavus]UNE48751.1 cytochrome ubiquinol oxidase subunit I [Aquisalinus flavus]GGD14486.1 cytochrome ubiquinol oxidase subunit I [Aquisalinus flavus]
MDALLLARIQFAFTISFHFIFPAFTIGLASYLAVLNGLYLRTNKDVYLRLFRYWVKIFAITFAMGVVSGITMSYQFGTNWSVFSDRAGPVIGPLMAYEVLTAFFLEAGFLGIMLFGRNRVGPTLHMIACLAVAFGTALSATWILSVNSWMHTPAGFVIAENGQFLPENWLEIIFNPSFPYRLSHTLTAAYLTTAFIIGGVGALHLLRGERDNEGVKVMFSMAMWMAAIVAPVQIFLGDLHGLNTLEHQPQKIMAMEGHYESHPEGAPLYLFGIPDDEAQELKYAIGIPKLSSLILEHDLNAPMAGLDTIPDDEQPPVAIVFWSFRIMVAMGFLMLGVGLFSLWARWKNTLYTNRWLHRAALIMTPSGLVAVLAGWITTEVGRQPYTIYGLMRTEDSVSPIAAPAVAGSLLFFIVVYFLVFGAGVFYLMRLANRPPQLTEERVKDQTGPIRAAGITPASQIILADPDDPRIARSRINWGPGGTPKLDTTPAPEGESEGMTGTDTDKDGNTGKGE